MAHSSDRDLRVMMPPEFEYLGGLFLPDPGRARLVDRVSAAVAEWRRQGYPVRFDPGCEGLTAGQSAALLTDEGTARAVVIGRASDRTGAGILQQALELAGIHCPPPLLSAVEGADILPHLRQAADAMPRSAAPLAEDAAPGERTGSIPPWAGEVRVIPPRSSDLERALSGLDGDEATVLYGLTLPGVDGGTERVPGDWLRRAGGFIEQVGAGQCRLVGPARGPRPGRSDGGAAWAARYGIDTPSIRETLLELVSGWLPKWYGLLLAVIGMYETGVDPLEEMYAGNSLVDRNTELIENIVP